jgi:prepilin-type N-terminal cleavage/methylation domain-containing protein
MTLQQRRGPEGSSQDGFTLLEVFMAMTIVAIILLGVMGSISTASFAERNAGESLQSQMLLNQVIEELQDNPFSNLLSFNGQFVTSGDHRADILVGLLSPDLARIQVSVTSTLYPEVSTRALVFISNTEN